MEWINAFLYIALFIVLYRFNRNRFSIFISAIWGFSAFLGLFYVHSEVYREGVYKTSLIPFLYLFLMFLISIFPFIKEKDSIKNISFRSPKIIKNFCKNLFKTLDDAYKRCYNVGSQTVRVLTLETGDC